MTDQPVAEAPKKKVGRPPGFKGQANRDIHYVCDRCGQEKTKDTLLAKRATFLKIGKPIKSVRSRVVAWLCMDCVAKDPDWNQPALTGAPGMRDTQLGTAKKDTSTP